MSRLIIVSNRLPITVSIEESGSFTVARSSGGLATGLSRTHSGEDSIWVGYPGEIRGLNKKRRQELDALLVETRLVPVALTTDEVRRYYEGYSNGVIWPLFHYLLDKVDLDSGTNWRTYETVNRKFAEAVAEAYRPGDLIWIQDYQLMLLPAMLREVLPDARIGFFLHIPFPSAEVFRILPQRELILRGLLGADLIGFHTFAYARHFATALLHVLGLESAVDSLIHQGRTVRFGVFPMGIDAESFNCLARSEEVQREMERILADLHGCRMFLSIDRLDYTKGLRRRLLSFEQLLLKRPDLRGRVKLLQVVVPSRTKVDSYAQFSRQVDELVGRINGAFSDVHYSPVQHLYRSIDEVQLSALYRAADVMLVTPLRDGMNLVSKEFVASRIDEDGVLVLSEFAGAAAELGEAISINPYDLESQVTAMEYALSLPQIERRTRIRALRKRVFNGSVHKWAASFIENLELSEPAIRQTEAKKPSPFQRLEDIAGVARILLLLDYDGTLVGFQPSPLLATPDDNLRTLLSSLGNTPGIQTHIVSGRMQETMEQWFGDLPVGLHAEHGYWSRSTPGNEWIPIRKDAPDWKSKILPIFESFVVQTPGTLIEEKTGGVTWHYRMANPEHAARQARDLLLLLNDVVANLPIEILRGEKIIEVREHGVNKGAVLKRLVQENPEALLIVIGDDRTDEDMFEAAPDGAISILVGKHASHARYQLPNPTEVLGFLKKIIAVRNRSRRDRDLMADEKRRELMD